MKKRICNILYIYILLQPFIDLITSLMTKYLNTSFTIGTLIKGIVFIISLIYILFITKSKYKKYSRIYLLVLGIYLVIYFLTKKSLFSNFNQLYTEVMYVFKFFFTIVTLIGLVNFFDEFRPNNRRIFKVLQLNLFIYCLIIFLANITGTAFGTYSTIEFGNTGWFYSGNEISVTVALLFPLLYLLINKATTYKALIYIIPIIFGIEYIGTKTSILGLILPTIIFLFYYLIRIKQGKKKQFIMALIVLFIIVISAPNLPVIDNIKDNITKFELRMLNKNRDKDYSDKVVSSLLLSNRDFYARKVARIYKKASPTNKLFGLGFTNRKEIDNKQIEKLIEMDYHDIFYRYGIVGTIIYLLPFIIITIYVFKKLLMIKFKMNKKQLTLFYISYTGLLISGMSGHTLGSPAVAIYLDIAFVLMLYYFKNDYYKIDIADNKITILTKNITPDITGYISNLLKVTKDKYQINLITTYKPQEDKVNDKVVVSNLINDYPHTKELREAYKNKKCIKVIKYGYNVCKIAILSYFKNAIYIEETDSKFIITDNKYHNKLVGRNKNRDSISISLEYKDNYDKKYIKKTAASCNNIDYLIVPSKKMEKVYQDKLHDYNTTSIFIPINAKSMFEKEWSNLLNKE